MLTAIDWRTGKDRDPTRPERASSPSSPATPSCFARCGVGALQSHTGGNDDLAISGTGDALSALGLTGNTGTGTILLRGPYRGGWQPLRQDLDLYLLQRRYAGTTSSLVTRFNGTVKTLDELNAALLANNLNATLDSAGKLTISTTNDYASSTLGSVGGRRRDRRHADRRRSRSRPRRLRWSTRRRRPFAATW